jgi:hypothetical protein
MKGVQPTMKQRQKKKINKEIEIAKRKEKIQGLKE